LGGSVVFLSLGLIGVRLGYKHMDTELRLRQSVTLRTNLLKANICTDTCRG